MLSAQVSLSFYGIFVQRVVVTNTCKRQQKYNSNIEENPLYFERFIQEIKEYTKRFTANGTIIRATFNRLLTLQGC